MGELAKSISKLPHSGRYATRAFRVTGSLKEAELRESVRTNRNCIRGTAVWVSNHIFTKPAANKHCCVDAAGIDFTDKCLTRGGLDEFVEKSAEAIVS